MNHLIHSRPSYRKETKQKSTTQSRFLDDIAKHNEKERPIKYQDISTDQGKL